MKFLSVLVLAIFIFSSTALANPAGLSNAINNFNWNYFKTLDKDKNIFYSPYSLVTALSILANGSKSTTQREILNALSTKNIQTLNDDFKNFRADSNLLQANLILIDDNFIGNGINSDFEEVVANIYGSEVGAANFKGNLDAEKRRIKNWVANHTNQFIPNYQSSVTEETILDLLNVIYFKGVWQNQFPLNKTWKSDFTNKDGSKSKVQMMSQTFKNKIAYYADEKYAGIVLPYDDNVSAMYVILPRGEGILNIADSWDAEEISYREDFLSNLKTAPIFSGTVEVFLPKFELDIKNNLNENLKQLGIQRAFTNSAEFSNILKKARLKISSSTHQAKIKVDEEGTEAAAITEFGMLRTTAAAPSLRIYFRADRPFLFVIGSEVDLFTGVVNSL